jgi:hypothetical protein
MLNEDTLTEPKASDLNADPNLSGGGSWAGDVLIRGREFVLNRLSGAKPSLVINQAKVEMAMPPGADLAARLKQTLDDLKRSVMDEDGASVDYAALRSSSAYAAYQVECLAALRQFKPHSLPTEHARRAFWINLYNALVLDAVITFGVQRSVTEGRLGMLTFFRRAAYVIDGQRVSLEDIEHGILRGNRGNPYVPGAHFASDDSRLVWSLPLDPRLHFALNCGGRSCPPIRSYSPDKLDAQLDLATRGFVDASVELRPETNELWLSRILQWYGSDFGGREGVLDFLIRYLPDDERRNYLSQQRETLQLNYRKYDWQLNRS